MRSVSPSWSLVLLAVGCGASTTEPDAGDTTVDVVTIDDTPASDAVTVSDVPVASDVVTAGDVVTASDVQTPSDVPTATVDCARFATMANVRACGPAAGGCGVVFSASQGCPAVCAAAGMRCLASHEDVSNACAADTSRPALNCAATGHQSDYCVCAPTTGACVPACSGRVCGDDGCGGSCGSCASGTTCVSGACRPRAAVACSSTDCPAFPGAEGAGRNARGGRGGDVYHVTHLNDSGAGSLRDALTSARGPRTVVFDVAGLIDLRSPLRATVNRLTLAGQTAPGDGVTTQGFQVELRGTHIIVQHMRFRAGDLRRLTSSRPTGFTEDSLTVGGTDVIVDHVSASWGIDENLSTFSERWDRLTVQHSFITEGLYHTGLFHGELDPSHPGHSMGSLFKPREGDSTVSVHHNLFAHNGNRNPAVGSYSATQTVIADIRNNVIYDCRNMGYTSGDSRAVLINYVGNYGILGPSSSSTALFDGAAANHVRIFQSDNRRDANRNGRFDGSDDGWSAITGEYARASAPFALPAVTTQRPEAALETVLTSAGARPWSRDSVDQRVVGEVRSGRGRIIDSQRDVGGWGTLAGGAVTDRDRDGMPDAWESAHGTDPARADHNGDVDGDGYTNLENYLHDAARWPR
ncbi:MAG: hypothetical protein R3A48_29235 [Polyangiales bacterium]